MLRILPLILVLACVVSARQSTPSEWGEVSPQTSRTGQTRYDGQVLYISDCHGQICRFTIDCEGLNTYCYGSGDLDVTSPEIATATLKPPIKVKGYKCTLKLQLSGAGAGKSIIASIASGDCGYYCKANGQMEGRLPFRTSGKYYGSDLRACFSDLSRARSAICENQSLAEAESRWMSLLENVGGVRGGVKNVLEQVLNAMRSCDTQGDAKACVENLMQSNISDLTRQKNELMAGITEAGDPQEASRQITAIVGSYRSTHENGDMQGGTYLSTDSLDIKLASATSISFNAHLEFFNGHECNAEGMAEFKKAGVFVYRAPEPDNACYLEIIPKVDGVQLADPTNQCRMLTCGARGGLNGASFRFTDRVKGNR